MANIRVRNGAAMVWRVEVLNEVAAAEILALPADM
jgi:hypothetical protein